MEDFATCTFNCVISFNRARSVSIDGATGQRFVGLQRSLGSSDVSTSSSRSRISEFQEEMEDFRREVLEDVRREIREEVSQVRRQVQEEVRREVKEEVRREIEEEIRREIQEEIRREFQDALRRELSTRRPQDTRDSRFKFLWNYLRAPWFCHSFPGPNLMILC